MATIREATKVALAVAAIGLLCVGLALVLRENQSENVTLRITVEYYAALLFFLAVSITRNGVWGERQNRMLVPRDDWLRLAPWHHRPLPGRHRGGDPFPHRVGRPWPVDPRRRP